MPRHSRKSPNRGGLLSALDYIDYEEIERGAAGFEYFGMSDAGEALRAALELAFPDGPVAADEREDHTLGLPAAVLERIEGELEDAYNAEADAYGAEADAISQAFARVYRDRPDDFEPV